MPIFSRVSDPAKPRTGEGWMVVVKVLNPHAHAADYNLSTFQLLQVILRSAQQESCLYPVPLQDL